MNFFLKQTAILALTATPCLAQSSDWNYAATFYLFTPQTNIGIDDIDTELSFSDAFDNLDMAFMVAFEANNGRWGFLGDYMMTDLAFDSDTSGPVFSGAELDLKTQIFNGYATYRVFEDPGVSVDLAAGFRWFETSTDLTLLPGIAAGRSASVQESWVDPVVGIRSRFKMSDRWSGTVFADFGGSGGGSETWQVLLSADYTFSNNWVGRIGYRQISVEHDISGTAFSFEQSGPIVGIAYQY